MREPLAHMKIHPTHEGKHATIKTMHLAGFHLENRLEQVFVGHYPQEGLAHDDEACQL